MVEIVICDIDGTIADMGKQGNGRRGPFDWDREDEPIWPIVQLVKILHQTCYNVVFVSGRMETARAKTRS